MCSSIVEAQHGAERARYSAALPAGAIREFIQQALRTDASALS